jgi:hypothetical protein
MPDTIAFLVVYRCLRELDTSTQKRVSLQTTSSFKPLVGGIDHIMGSCPGSGTIKMAAAFGALPQGM